MGMSLQTTCPKRAGNFAKVWLWLWTLRLRTSRLSGPQTQKVTAFAHRTQFTAMFFGSVPHTNTKRVKMHTVLPRELGSKLAIILGEKNTKIRYSKVKCRHQEFGGEEKTILQNGGAELWECAHGLHWGSSTNSCSAGCFTDTDLVWWRQTLVRNV